MDPQKVLAIIEAILNAMPGAAPQDREHLAEGVLMMARQLLTVCRSHYDSDPMIIQKIGKLGADVRRFAEIMDDHALAGAHASVHSLKGVTGFGIKKFD